MSARALRLAISALMLALTAALAPYASAAVADKEIDSVAVCAMKAKLQVQSLHILVGISKGRGDGELVCSYANGAKQIIPITLETDGVGFGAGLSSTNAYVFTPEFGFSGGGACNLLGSYAIAKASTQIVLAGIEAGLGLTATRNGFSIPIDMKLKTGPGLELAADFGRLKIKAKGHFCR